MVSDDNLQHLIQKLSDHFHHGPPMALTRYLMDGVYDISSKLTYSIDQLKGLRVIAVTAIANPESFYRYLETFGVEICGKVSFPDHYFFSPEDVNELLIKASQESAIILCSEKDMVKMKRVSLNSRIYFTKVKVEFITGEQELLSALSKVLRLDSSDR